MPSRGDIDATATAVVDAEQTVPESGRHADRSEQPAPLASRLGRYVLLREIGAGAIGVVYAAYHEGLDRKLAIKVLNHRRAGRADLEGRLRREAKALAKLSHPNVVQVYDVGEFDGRVFVAMEFVEGQTLGEWLRSKRSLGERLATLIAAGRGLAAAHQAGVIHRDFKPDNVLVGRDGRPRVLDFGLARAGEPRAKPAAPPVRPRPGAGPLQASLAQRLSTDQPTLASRNDGAEALEITIESAGEPHADEPHADEPGDEVVTRDGALLGTPAYMSPEQLLGQPVDHASDQFGFCVALYEALYGQRPFAGKSTIELALQTQAGEVSDPPPGAEVPPRLRQILLRGLSPRPSDRWPSMDALLAELEHDPSQARRRRLLTVLAAAAVASLAFVVGALAPKRAPSCPEPAEVVAELWSPDRGEQLRRTFERSRLPFADTAWAGAAQRLDAWARAWATQRVEACEATHLRQEFSLEVLDLRLACLDRGRRAFAALTEEFASADAKVIERAIEAAAALPDPNRCGEVEVLLAGAGERPPPAAVAAEVEGLREQLAAIETFANTGRWQQGLARAREALERARASAYGPVLAEALFVHGRLLAESGAGGEARAKLEDALDEAERSGHDELVPRVATELVSLSIYTRPDPIRGRIWARRSIAALDRVDARGLERARGLRALGNLERLDGNNAEAEARLREALALILDESAEHPERALVLNDLGNALEAQGRFDPARRVYAQALAAATEAFGPAHPRVGHAHYNLARLAFAEQRFGEARRQLDRARRIYTDSHGPRHRDVGSVELLAANLAIAEGELDAAAVHARMVRDIYAAELAPDNVDRAEPELLLGHIAFARGELDSARTHYRACLAIQRAALPPGHISLALTLTNLGLVHLALAEHDAAVDQLGEALALLEAGASVNPEELRMARQYLDDALRARAGADEDE